MTASDETTERTASTAAGPGCGCGCGGRGETASMGEVGEPAQGFSFERMAEMCGGGMSRMMVACCGSSERTGGGAGAETK